MAGDESFVLWSLIIYPFNERLALIRLFHSPEEESRLWDELSQKRHTIAIAGADAEAKIFFGGNTFFRFPSYESLFRLVRNHVLIRSELTGNPFTDSDKISHAIRGGQFYIIWIFSRILRASTHTSKTPTAMSFRWAPRFRCKRI